MNNADGDRETSVVEAGLENLKKLKEQGPRPAINGGRNATEERRVRSYLMDWYQGTPDDFDIDWTKVTIIVSARLSRSWGKARNIRWDDRQELKISRKAIERHGWDSIKQTIRHEAIHIWQYQELGSGGHGPSFKKWARKFDCRVRAPDTAGEAKYLLFCSECGDHIGHRMRSCKVTKHPGWYRSRCCGAGLRVEENANA